MGEKNKKNKQFDDKRKKIIRHEGEYDDDYLCVIRLMIQHENNLIDNRMAWMWALQGLLYGSLSFSFFKENSTFLVIVIACTGLISCLSIGYSLINANLAISRLRKKEKKYLSRFKKNEIKNDIPPAMGYKKGFKYFLPWILLPWIFGLSWIIIIVVKLFTRNV